MQSDNTTRPSSNGLSSCSSLPKRPGGRCVSDGFISWAGGRASSGLVLAATSGCEPASPLVTQQERAEQATQLSTYFWAMANIAVKSVLRHQAWAAVSHLEGLRGIVHGMKRLVGLSTIREGQEEWRTTLLPPVHRAEQMAMLRDIAREMEHLTNAIELIGGQAHAGYSPCV